MINPRSSQLAGRRVLVTDGEQRSALAIVRSLGAAGAAPFVVSTTGASLAGASRFAAAEDAVVDPLARPAEFVGDLVSVIERRGVDTLIPVTEAALRPVLESRASFPGIELPFPSLDTFARASNKRQVAALAAELGLPVPRQLTVESADDLSQLGPRDLDYPIVLKPAVSVVQGDRDSRKLTVSYARDRAELIRRAAGIPPGGYPLLLQERIVGPGVGIFLLRYEGRILARFAHRRLREKPPSGGVSVYREAIPLPRTAVEYAECLLQHLDWQGVAMVEFKYSRDTDVPYLMEINGRFWGSLQLAIDAGVDFPRLLLEAVAGQESPKIVEGRAGLRLRWLLGDLDHLLIRLRSGAGDSSLPPDALGRASSLARFLIPWRPGDRWEVLRPSDPQPFAHELTGWIRDVRKSRQSRGR